MTLTSKEQIAVNTTNIADLVAAAETAQRVRFLEKTFDDHCKKQNGSMEKMADAIIKSNEDNLRGHERIHQKIEEVKEDIHQGIVSFRVDVENNLKNTVSKKDAFKEKIYTSVITAVILYLIFDKFLGK